jgi:hypothetical protein
LGCAHRFRPTYPDFLHEAPPTSTCAAFIKESRMKVVNASKVNRKSGVRWCERGAPVRFPLAWCVLGGRGEGLWYPTRSFWVTEQLTGQLLSAPVSRHARTTHTAKPAPMARASRTSRQTRRWCRCRFRLAVVARPSPCRSLRGASPWLRRASGASRPARARSPGVR